MNINKLLLGAFQRLRHSIRWSLANKIHKENVAEHSYYTALYALFIMQSLPKGHGVTASQAYDCLARCLTHDFDEAFSGDLPRMFKHANPTVRKAIDEAASGYVRKHIFEVAEGFAGEYLFDTWCFAKAHDKIGRIVAMADFLSVLSYVIQELRTGNVSILDHCKTELSKYYEEFTTPEYTELLPEWVAAAGRLIDYMLVLANERREDLADEWKNDG